MLLTDKAATRIAILDTFRKHLTENNNVDAGDALIFFYAGHGSRVMTSDDWPATDGKIETICPYDERKDENGQFIYGIPGRTMNGLFRRLAAIKGNNIVRVTALSTFLSCI
jgi:hypothetical protein